jgi:hypothetical protein
MPNQVIPLVYIDTCNVTDIEALGSPESQFVIDCNRDLLVRSEVTFGRLNGRVPQQKFNLLQIAAVITTKLGAGSSQIVRAEGLDANLFCRLFDD